MKKTLITIVSAILVLSLNACVPDIDNTDNRIDNSVTYGEGTVLVCTDAVCEVASEDEITDVVVGEYNPNYTQTECEAAGFFYCTLQDACLNQKLTTGTCG